RSQQVPTAATGATWSSPSGHPLIVPQNRSLQIVHALGRGERPRAARAIALGVEPLGGAITALNDACARSSARLTEPGVGWRSSWAPIDGGAIGPAPGFPADCRTAFSNCAILLLQGPACADATPRGKAAPTTKAAIHRRFMDYNPTLSARVRSRML